MATILHRTGKRYSAILLLTLFALLSSLVAACGSANQTGSAKSYMTIVPDVTGDLTRNFNPYSANVTYGSQGMMYETLLFFNRNDNSVKPWLASSYQFSSDNTSITFHLRSGVKWSDGQPFSSADVVFTLNLLKKYPAMDLNSMWPFMNNVAAPDANTVVVTLQRPFTPLLWYLGGQTYILPEHQWSSVSGDASQYADPNPVGTGPYMLKSFTPALLTLVKNPHFWQPGQPKIDELKYPAYNSNTSAELVLHQGSIDWTGLYTPDIQKTYVSLDPTHNHYWFPASDIVMLYLNLAKYPFNLLPVREAISDAIDRNQLYQVGESGYEPPASPTGLVLPADNSFVNAQYSNLSFSVNTAQAVQLLQQAGFSKGADGIFADKQGRKLSFGIDVVDGYTDWITSCQIMANNLKAIGMNVNVNIMSYDAYYNAMQMGTFQTAISGTNAGPSPYYLYDGLLRSTNSAPVGQQASTNFERWINPNTDTLLNEYATTTSTTVQTQAIDGLEKIMVEQLPSIPLMNEPFWYEFNTAHFTGWPDQSHPYAEPSPYTYPDDEIVVLNLKPVS